MRGLTFAFLCLCVSALEVSAAEKPPVSKGARVRVSSPALKAYPLNSLEKRGPSKIKGIVTSIDRDTLKVRADDRYGAVLSIPVSSIKWLDVRRGTRRKIVEGAGLGLLLGAGLGAALGPMQDEKDSFFTDGQASVLTGAFLGGVGLVVGAIAGAAKRGDRWERWVPGRIQFGVLPGRRSTMVAAAVSF